MSKEIFSDFPNWIFEIKETSMNVYKVKGSDKFGHTVELEGFDDEKLLKEAKEWIVKNGLRK